MGRQKAKLSPQGAAGKESVTLASPFSREAGELDRVGVGSSSLGLLQPPGGLQEIKQHIVAKCSRNTQSWK